jgi:cytochrome d ubiquinol oxidase subunit I
MTTADSASAVGAPAVATSLIAFIVVYFALFGAGTVYILRLMAKPPATSDVADAADTGPTRAAGLTPAPSVAPDKVFPAE